SNNIYTAIFTGLTSAALLSNYQMIMNLMNGIISSIFTSITSSIGNAIFTDDEKADNSYKIFRIILIINCFLVSVCSVGFIVTSNALISFWIGDKYILPLMTVIMLGAYFYFTSTRLAVGQFLNASGICYEDRYIPLIEAAVNIVFCLLLGSKYGMIGVIAGNLISTLAIVYWQKPWLLFKYVLKRSPLPYFRDISLYVIATIISLALSMLTSKAVNIQNEVLFFVVMGFASVLFTTGVFFIMFFKTQPFKDSITLMLNLKKHTQKN
ncbi:MAG: hypothetical protein WA125_15145, partial [Desulfosporosinus sp.]